ncbi:hypothetical protein ADUPG1_010427 [Aduncisulcus paluster]|uniref:ARID domain-containing protein n=1 Tax=Aduncisulcus paluster TaxID=2918883 RepID=A0ABQ5JRB8_9EUKA|nr:hypothetical protein ADUPG1_010427 [Aduncisulcus paluster]
MIHLKTATIPSHVNTDQKRKIFNEYILSALTRDKKVPKKHPVVAGKPLSFFDLFLEVERRGGFDLVYKNKLFKEVGKSMNLNVTSVGFLLRTRYQTYIEPYVKKLRQLVWPDSPAFDEILEDGTKVASVPSMMHSTQLSPQSYPSEVTQPPIASSHGVDFTQSDTPPVHSFGLSDFSMQPIRPGQISQPHQPSHIPLGKRPHGDPAYLYHAHNASHGVSDVSLMLGLDQSHNDEIAANGMLIQTSTGPESASSFSECAPITTPTPGQPSIGPFPFPSSMNPHPTAEGTFPFRSLQPGSTQPSSKHDGSGFGGFSSSTESIIAFLVSRLATMSRNRHQTLPGMDSSQSYMESIPSSILPAFLAYYPCPTEGTFPFRSLQPGSTQPSSKHDGSGFGGFSSSTESIIAFLVSRLATMSRNRHQTLPGMDSSQSYMESIPSSILPAFLAYYPCPSLYIAASTLIQAPLITLPSRVTHLYIVHENNPKNSSSEKEDEESSRGDIEQRIDEKPSELSAPLPPSVVGMSGGILDDVLQQHPQPSEPKQDSSLGFAPLFEDPTKETTENSTGSVSPGMSSYFEKLATHFPMTTSLTFLSITIPEDCGPIDRPDALTRCVPATVEVLEIHNFKVLFQCLGVDRDDDMETTENSTGSVSPGMSSYFEKLATHFPMTTSLTFLSITIPEDCGPIDRPDALTRCVPATVEVLEIHNFKVLFKCLGVDRDDDMGSLRVDHSPFLFPNTLKILKLFDVPQFFSTPQTFLLFPAHLEDLHIHFVNERIRESRSSVLWDMRSRNIVSTDWGEMDKEEDFLSPHISSIFAKSSPVTLTPEHFEKSSNLLQRKLYDPEESAEKLGAIELLRATREHCVPSLKNLYIYNSAMCELQLVSFLFPNVQHIYLKNTTVFRLCIPPAFLPPHRSFVTLFPKIRSFDFQDVTGMMLYGRKWLRTPVSFKCRNIRELR